MDWRISAIRLEYSVSIYETNLQIPNIRILEAFPRLAFKRIMPTLTERVIKLYAMTTLMRQPMPVQVAVTRYHISKINNIGIHKLAAF